MRKFIISIRAHGEVDEQLPISYKVYEYLEDFIIKEVLVPKKIILNAKPNGALIFTSITGGKVTKDKPTVLRRRFVYDNYFSLAIIPTEPITSSTEPYLRTIELLFEGITIFLTKNYKSVKPGFMQELWQKVDLKYLLNLPYPAPQEEIMPERLKGQL